MLQNAFPCDRSCRRQNQNTPAEYNKTRSSGYAKILRKDRGCSMRKHSRACRALERDITYCGRQLRKPDKSPTKAPRSKKTRSQRRKAKSGRHRYHTTIHTPPTSNHVYGMMRGGVGACRTQRGATYRRVCIAIAKSPTAKPTNKTDSSRRRSSPEFPGERIR